MPDSSSAANPIYPAHCPSETPARDSVEPALHYTGGPATQLQHHGDHAPRLNTGPPATSTRQPAQLGVLSTVSLLRSTASAPTTSLSPRTHNDTITEPALVPAIVTHAASPDAQEPRPSDLTASTSSVPSTTTTLTNTLPPTTSAALRALNAPAFQSSHASSSHRSKAAKSTSSRTTVSSQPVVVRTYSGPRHSSRPNSGLSSPRIYPHSMNGYSSPHASALSAGLAAGRGDRLPNVEDFSFSAILRAVDPEIRDAIDAIAEICARSRLSLADEYDAHLPPQGEITTTGPGWATGMGTLVGRGRASRVGQNWSAGENTLTAVPEASSSSERLADTRGNATNKKRSQSAYGSLKSVISGGSGKRRATEDTFTPPEPTATSNEESKAPPGPAWAVNTASLSSTHPSITIVTSPQASNQLSLDQSSTITDKLDLVPVAGGPSPKQLGHRRNTSSASMPASRTRSGPLSSFASWLPWNRPSDLDTKTEQELTKAEARLREMLEQSSSIGKGKTPISVA